MKREAKASGTSSSFSELDQLIEECLEVEKLEQDLDRKMVGKLVLIFVLIFLGLARNGLKRVDSKKKKLQYL